MKLKHEILVYTTASEIHRLASVLNTYPDTKGIQIDFRDNEIEIFNEEGHLLADWKFDQIFG